jgi:hypothetical protein
MHDKSKRSSNQKFLAFVNLIYVESPLIRAFYNINFDNGTTELVIIEVV